MKNRKTRNTSYRIPLIVTLGFLIVAPTVSEANNKIKSAISLRLDSVGNETVNGNSYIIHKVKPKETYYQLSRIYTVPVKDIISTNNNKTLRIGDTVRIPMGKVTQAYEQSIDKITVTPATPPKTIEYKVGKSETLYAISKRFQITIKDIKLANNLTSDSLKEGMLLKIPINGFHEEKEEQIDKSSVIIIPETIDQIESTSIPAVKTNKYGIRENKERGIGVWLEDLKTNGQSSLALHKTAPIGTILKITNPMNQNVTFAKVVGKFADNEETQNAIVVLSKSVANSIGLIDKKFQIEITYGTPLDLE